jgi:acyl carrier protein
MDNIKESIRGYILEEFLPGENPAALTDTTALITGGILDSLATVKLVAYIEENFGVQVQAHEMTADYLDTVASIAELVQSKK